MNNVSLRKKLLVIFLVLFSIPIIVSLLLLNFYATQYSKYSDQILNEQNIAYVGESINDFFNSAYDFSLYLNSQEDILSYLSVSQEELYQSNLSTSVQNAVSLLPFSNTNISAILLEGNDGRSIQSGSTMLSISDAEKEQAIAANGSPCWTITADEISLVRLVRSPDKLSKSLGFLKIKLNQSILVDLFRAQTYLALEYDITAQDNTLQYIISQDSDFVAPTITATLLETTQATSLHFPENNCFLSVYPLEAVSGYVYCYSSDQYSTQVFSVLLNTLFISMAICFAFCFMLSLIFSATIVSPLKKLGKLMKCIENEDFSVQFKPKSQDEIGQLALQFDHMTKRLNTLYNQVYVDKIKLKEMQLSALQAQINPHFLYNTLDTIYWMSEINHTNDVSNMINALSRLFRLALSGDEKDMVSLDAEIEHLECYLYIQKIRHSEGFDYTIVNKATEKTHAVLKLILQPLVENAIIHGIEHVEHGVVDILIYETEHHLIYEISDTAGTADLPHIQQILCAELLPQSEEKHHIGLRNIQTRIHLRYGNQYGVSCDIKNGKTIFTVKLPLDG